jgi:hypothetical protein
MAKKKHNVIFARRADIMMVRHTEFMAQVSVGAARRLLVDFKKVTKQLEDDPYRFPYADEIDAPGVPPEKYRKCLFFERYKALFTIENDNVFVDAIIDCRQKNNGLFSLDE